MAQMTIYLLAVLWYLSGVVSFIYWWTSDYDLDIRDAAFALLVGVAGPIVFVMGAMIHGKGQALIKKRRKP